MNVTDKSFGWWFARIIAGVSHTLLILTAATCEPIVVGAKEPPPCIAPSPASTNWPFSLAAAFSQWYHP